MFIVILLADAGILTQYMALVLFLLSSHELRHDEPCLNSTLEPSLERLSHAIPVEFILTICVKLATHEPELEIATLTLG